MRIPLLRTLSARIILGFAVLTLTFGTVSVVTVGNLDLLSREIRVIRTGYLPLALVTKDLADTQKTLRAYLRDGLEGESNPAHVRAELRGLRAARSRLLHDAARILARQHDLPPTHRQAMALAAQRIEELRRQVDALNPLYQQLLAAPPIARARAAGSGSRVAPAALEAASRALEVLREREGRIHNRTFALETQQRNFVERTAVRLEQGEHKLRLYTIYLGVTAVLVGLLITLWATLTLRPLRRLGDAARRIAHGDYASRIEEAGPREVAELAREFNVMGRAVEQRERDLVRSERLAAVGQMAAMITHEIRNPLSSIGLNAELLEEELGGAPKKVADEARGLCRAIQTEIDRLTAITEEYLRFARLPKPKLQEDELNPVVENLVEFEREQLSLRGVSVEVSLAPRLPPVLIDDSQLRQALLNLLRNAADALEEIGGGAIEISTRLGDAPTTVEVRVADNGPGIGEELAPKLFEPFFSTKEGGTGLGLALTHQIVKEHGGRVSVDSAPGHGTAFTIVLPQAASVPRERRGLGGEPSPR